MYSKEFLISASLFPLKENLNYAAKLSVGNMNDEIKYFNI